MYAYIIQGVYKFMVKKNKKISREYLSISPRLNSALKIIKAKTHMPNAHIAVESIAIPLSEILATKGDNASFSVYPHGDSIIIQVYGRSIFANGKLTDDIYETLGVELSD